MKGLGGKEKIDPGIPWTKFKTLVDQIMLLREAKSEKAEVIR